MRESLNLNKTYTLQTAKKESRTFHLTEMIGFGASCLVYDAYYEDDLNFPHTVRLKECFPQMECEEMRTESDAICWRNEERRLKAFARWEKSYAMHLQLQQKTGLMNKTSRIGDELYYGNNTVYTVMECDEGESYHTHKKYTLYDELRTLKSLVHTVSLYHRYHFLHLDLKPENFMVIPETPELVKLFDFDSIVPLGSLKRGEIRSVSYSKEWAAPEVCQGKIGKIDKTADVYSIGAILYDVLFQEAPGIDAVLNYGTYDYTKAGILHNVNPAIRRYLTEFLKKTLAPAPRNRYASMEEVEQALDEMIQIADPSRFYLCSRMPKQSHYFAGRKTELQKALQILKSGNIVCVTGMGGIGKSEFSRHFAQQYQEEFSQVVWVKVEESVKAILKNHSAFVIANERPAFDGNRFEVLRQAVDANTLIILDDIKDYKEEFLHEFLSLPCKFMLTSRVIPDGIFDTDSQIRLNCMDMETLKGVFYHYYEKQIRTENEEEFIEKIIKALGFYTLLVPIAAKQAVSSAISLEDLWKKISEKRMQDRFPEKVLHIKDNEIIEQEMYGHASRLFSWVELSEEERIVLRVLSTLEGIHVSRKELAGWCGLYQEEKKRFRNIFEELTEHVDLTAINALIRKGFLNFDAEIDRVYLHDVMQMVALQELKPSVENCGGFRMAIEALCDELEEWDEGTGFAYHEEYVNQYVVDMYGMIIFEYLKNLDYHNKANGAMFVSVMRKLHETYKSAMITMIAKLERTKAMENWDPEIQASYFRWKMHCIREAGSYYLDKIDGLEDSYLAEYKAMRTTAEWILKKKNPGWENCICEMLKSRDLYYSYRDTWMYRMDILDIDEENTAQEPEEKDDYTLEEEFINTEDGHQVYECHIELAELVLREGKDAEAVAYAEEFVKNWEKAYQNTVENMQNGKVKTTKVYTETEMELDECEEYMGKMYHTKTSQEYWALLDEILETDTLTIDDKFYFLEGVGDASLWARRAEVHGVGDLVLKHWLDRNNLYCRFINDMSCDRFHEESCIQYLVHGYYKNAMEAFWEYINSLPRHCSINRYGLLLPSHYNNAWAFPDLLDRLGYHALCQLVFRAYAIGFTEYDEEEIQESDMKSSILQIFSWGKYYARKNNYVEEYKYYGQLLEKFAHITFEYAKDEMDFSNSYDLRAYINLQKKCFSVSSDKERYALIREIRESHMEPATKKLMIDYLNAPVSFREREVSAGSKRPEYFIVDKKVLADAVDKLENTEDLCIMEEIPLRGEVVLQSILLEKENCQEAIEAYKALLPRIMNSEVKNLGVTRYLYLPGILAEDGYEEAWEIYRDAAEQYLNEYCQKMNYYYAKLSAYEMERMYRTLVDWNKDGQQELYVKWQQAHAERMEYWRAHVPVEPEEEW